MAARHVAILWAPYIRLILDGRKTIESRLTRTARAPYRRIATGDRIYFKCSAGPYMAAATAGRVLTYDRLTPARVRELRQKYNTRIGGDPPYWCAKRDSRYATLVWLRNVVPTDTGPNIPPSRGLAWFVLSARHADQRPRHTDATLTAGAIRNRYVRLGPTRLPGAGPTNRPIHLILPDRNTVTTEQLHNGMIRWRGWGPYFDAHHVAPGDRVRLTEAGPGRYRVSILPAINETSDPRTT